MSSPDHSLSLPSPHGRMFGRAEAVRIPYVNIWLVLLIVLGTLIVLGDGLTHPFDIEWETGTFDPLTHEAAPAAILFAAVTFPLALLYAAREGLKPRAGVLFWYVLGITTYTKDFAYLKLPDIPLYITDYVLAFLLIRVFVWPKLRWLPLRSLPMVSVLSLLVLGAVASVRGVLGGESVLLVARDFGLVAYSLFLLVGLVMFRTWDSVKRLFIFVGLGTVLLSLNAIGWFLNAPGQRRYVLYACILAFGFVMLALATLNRMVPLTLGWASTLIAGGGILLAASRAVEASLLVIMAVVFLFGPSVQRSSILARLKGLAAIVLVGIALLGVASQTKAGSNFMQNTLDEFVSGVLQSSDDPYAKFRFLAWAEAIRRFAEHPIIGEGYGVPFTLEDRYDPRPHNTYLTFLYKTGVVGFLVLAGILGTFFAKAFASVRRHRSRADATWLYITVLGLAAVCLTGNFTFLFESPFVAAPFWLLVAASFRIMSLLKTESLRETTA